MTHRLTLLVAAAAMPLIAASMTAPASAQERLRMQAPMAQDDSAGPEAFLRSARQSVMAGRYGEARERLEQAETRMLSRSVMPSRADTPAQGGAIGQIGAAREALGHRNRQAAQDHIDQAMAQLRQAPPMAGSSPAGPSDHMNGDHRTGSSMNGSSMNGSSMNGSRMNDDRMNRDHRTGDNAMPPSGSMGGGGGRDGRSDRDMPMPGPAPMNRGM